MKKFIQSILKITLIVLVLFSHTLPVCAEGYSTIEDYTDKVNSTDRVYDFANLFTDAEKKEIQKAADKAINHTKLDIVILTVEQNLGYSQTRLADDFFDYGGFGYKDSIDAPSGILLLVDMQAREIYISTAGIAILYFNDEIIEIILDDIADNASEGDYKRLCEEFCEDVVYYTGMAVNTDSYQSIIKEWNTGKYQDYSELYKNCREEFEKIGGYKFDYNKNGIVTKDKKKTDFYEMEYEGYHRKTFFTVFQNPLIDFIIGAVVSFITVIAMLNHSGNAMTAGSGTYRGTEGINLSVKQDKFIRRSTVSHTIQSSSGSSSKSGSGGGSSHRSSSGRSHGGGGRKF